MLAVFTGSAGEASLVQEKVFPKALLDDVKEARVFTFLLIR